MLEAVDVQKYDFVAIGSGLAGLAFALKAAEFGTVCVLTKSEVTDNNTSYAQGGIAAAVGEADTWQLHERDTLEAGAGLNNQDAVRFLVTNAPAAIEWLRSLGVQFSVGIGGGLELELEGGHTRKRIVHFEDRTGWEIERAMVAAVRKHPNIRVIEHAFATEVLVSEGRCVGVAAMLDELGIAVFAARAVLLATGGCGVMYEHSTNPSVATGDGIALADGAGVEIAGMEFVQFHPTALYHPKLRGFLITEACRGAGGTLRNREGRRFMYDYDERLDLAPRDIVARAIDAEMTRLRTSWVYLDLAHLPPGEVRNKFPTIFEALQNVGVQMDRSWIPVVPAQHYSCGGVTTDLQGRTGFPGLYAAGEVAWTGVHGANRLASNSLLEALVFAASAAERCRTEPAGPIGLNSQGPPRSIAKADAVSIRRKLQRSMTRNVGIVRSNAGLETARAEIARLREEFERKPEGPFSQYARETLNLLVAASYVVNGAMLRKVNAGLHYNEDDAQRIGSS